MNSQWITPQWSAPSNVGVLMTTRAGGVSHGAYASLNFGLGSGDDLQQVAQNRQLLAQSIGREVRWLKQVHGVKCVNADAVPNETEADALITCGANVALAVMVADCLPVLFASRDGECVAAAHAGWRGLNAGVLENTLSKMQQPASQIIAWLGPCIGATAFEVGQEVRDAFVATAANATNATNTASLATVKNDETQIKASVAATLAAFRPHPERPEKYLCNLSLLAQLRLRACGVNDIASIDRCTVSEPDYFFSYRRQAQTGRMAALIWKTS